MIQKMQRRLTAVLMLFLVGIYVGFCVLSYAAGVRGMERVSDKMFDPTEEVSRPQEDGAPHMPGQVGIPFFTVDLFVDGTMIHTERGQFTLSDEEIREITEEAFSTQQENGFLTEYTLRYVRQSTPVGWRLVFMDDSVRVETLRQQIRSSILLGLVLLPVFYLFSWGISALIVRPVRRAWAQQTQFVADASHELKTPLTVILSNTDMILADCDEPGGDLYRRADYIRQEAGRMRDLVQELLCLARHDESPYHQEKLTVVDLTAAAETAALSFEAVAYENGLTLETQLEQGLAVRGDQQQLDRLLHILLDNAVKYSLSGGMIRLALSAERGKQALLIVENPGELLSEEQLSKLFDRFYRTDESRGTKPGYGLGLSVAQQIVDRWGGKIRAEHHDGITKFAVRLPLAK